MSKKHVISSVRSSVWRSVQDEVLASVYYSMTNYIYDSFRASVWNSVDASVGEAVHYAVWDSVYDSTNKEM